MNIAVVGLGKIGLPLAVQYAASGHRVRGADVNAETVFIINAGREPFPGEAHLAEKLATTIADGSLTATTDTPSAVAQSETVVIVVPLFVNSTDEPDFDYMDSATADVGRGLSSGTLVSYETTVPVGTTRNRFKPMLERISNLHEGSDFHLVFSPERVLTGRVFADLRRYPKLVGALSPAGAQRAVDFYRQVLQFEPRADLPRSNGVWDLGSTEAAELAKLAETTYRDVNIGLANQFALFASKHGIDIHQVIEASNSQPYSHIHTPGIAVGGHCIPVYPRLYLWKDPTATVVRAAREANVAMPRHAVDMAEQVYGDLSDARVVVLGATYRGGVKESAYSGTFPTVAELLARGARVTVHDPMYSPQELAALGLTPHCLGDPVDIAILHTAHESYRLLSKSDFPGIRTVVDGRAILDCARFPGVAFCVIGKPVPIRALP